MGRRSKVSIRMENARNARRIHHQVNNLAFLSMAKISAELQTGGVPVLSELKQVSTIKGIVDEFEHEKLKIYTQG